MSAAIDVHYWITGFMYPLANSLLVAVALWGVAYTKFTYQFALIGVAAVLSVFISALLLILKLQKALEFTIIAKSTVRMIWPVQAVAEYISMSLYFVGFIWLVVCLKKAEERG